MTLPTYEVFAICYASRDGTRNETFLGGDAHDGPMPLNYYVWLIRNEGHAYVVDVGFTRESGERRGRKYVVSPKEGLARLGVDADEVRNVIITHLHWDHAGCLADFPKARFHLQDREMAFATGRHMTRSRFNHGYSVEDVVDMVRLVYKDRATFHNGSSDFAPGISLHCIGGHTNGIQCVRVHTARGWVVLASDACHFYEQMEEGRLFKSLFNVGDMLDGYDTLSRLAASPNHVIPGHDPRVMQIYPAVSRDLEGIAVRLDVAPSIPIKMRFDRTVN